MKTIRHIFSLFLAGLMLVASIGVTINSHICGGEVKAVALFVKADSCKPCQDADHHAKNNGCCEETSVVVKSDETSSVLSTITSLTPSFDFIAITLPVLYSISHGDEFVKTPLYTLYKPPLPERDISVLVHSFLI